MQATHRQSTRTTQSDGSAGTRLPRSLLPVCFAALLVACGGNGMTTGLVDDRLAPCPSSPNCVSSDATDEEHRVDAYRFDAPPADAWRGLREAVEAEERTTVITADDTYLHAEFRSAIFRFVDDAEFHLRPDDGIIAVRSASRVGYSDMGVNRKRVERIRDALRTRGLIE